MNKLTIDDILEMEPCSEYDRERLETLFDGRETVNEFDVADAPISNADKGWLLGRMLPWDPAFKLPEGVTDLWVENNPGLTELVVPEGVTVLRVENNDGLTELTVPEGVTYLRVENNDGLTGKYKG